MNTIQKSIFPELIADKIIISNKKKVNVRKKLKAFLKNEGPYKFARLAQTFLSQTDEYTINKFGISSADVYETAEGVFAEFTCDTLTIKQFLINTEEVPNYCITGFNENFLQTKSCGNTTRQLRIYDKTNV
jgi:hypothetical protein